MKKVFIIIRNLIYKIKYPRIKIDLISNIDPKFLYNLNKDLDSIILGKSFISKDVEINEGVKFLGKVICDGKVTIGRYTSINGPNTQISSAINSIKIGSFCSIASGVRIQEYFHEYRRTTSYYINRHIFKDKLEKDIFSKGNIEIEDDVWIGANTIILSGIKIGRGSIIGAGSVVTKNIESYSIAVGNPAKVIRKRFDEETINELENSKWWTWNIDKIKNNKEFFQLKRA